MSVELSAFIPSPSSGVWNLGPLPVRAYALCILIGIVVAVWVGNRRWVARGGKAGFITDVALWAVPFGIVGARLYHVTTDYSTYFGPNGLGLGATLKIWNGGLGIWGAVAGERSVPGSLVDGPGSSCLRWPMRSRREWPLLKLSGDGVTGLTKSSLAAQPTCPGA